MPARAVGIAPTSKMPANVHLAPYLSHNGPAARRTSIVATREMTLEFAMSFWESLRSFLMVSVIKGGKAYQLQKAMKNPHHESRKTRPYMLRGFKAGTDFALWLTGLISGAFHSEATEGGIALAKVYGAGSLLQLVVLESMSAVCGERKRKHR